MATLAMLLDDFRARLNDQGDTQVSKPEKIRYVNLGIGATFPSLYRVIRDTSVTLVKGTYEYPLPSAFAESVKVFRVEVESLTPGLWWRVEEFSMLPGDPVTLALPSLPSAEGAHLRVFAAVPLAALVADTDVYSGPAGSEEIPVLYAMSCASSRRIDDRIDYKRYTTTMGLNGVAVETLEAAANFWFNQFAVALDKAAVPLPGA